ncbi:MAG: AAA family ATPase [Planctomycetota bacterium]|nr:AAA family ATPase [Planctomycetota bacterium]
MAEINPPRAAEAAPANASKDDLALVETLRKGYDALMAEMGKSIVGQRDVLDQILIAMFCRGHALMVGVPGLAKTLMVRTLAQILDLSFNRVQFTPDLMPSDIVGTEVVEEDRATGQRSFRFVKGPVFANMILADEINRTPPKTQAALLEAMEEHRVTAGGETYPLPAPFFVLATQNPIEQEGTYPLPEAQLDRFMFEIRILYPSKAEEVEIVRQTTALRDTKLEPVMTSAQVLEVQRVVRKIPVGEAVLQYAVNLACASRPQGEDAPDFIKEWVRYGAGPRASQFLILGAKARAAIRGNFAVSVGDVKAVAPVVLRHRIVTNFHAESEGITSDEIVRRLIEHVKAG